MTNHSPTQNCTSALTEVRRAPRLVICLALLAACATAPSIRDIDVGNHRAAIVRDPVDGSGRRQPRGMAQVRLSPGDVEIDIGSGTDVTNETDGFYFGVATEGFRDTAGGGVQVGIYASDDDLLESSGSVDTSVLGLDLFPHFSFRPASDSFRMPIRLGPELQTHSLNLASVNTISQSIDWVSFGLTVEIEPEVDLFRTENSALSLYGRLRAGAGLALISATFEDYSTESQVFGAEIGLRWQISRFLLSAGYFSHKTGYAESDIEGNSFVEETDFTFQGGFVDMGVRW